MCFVLELIRHKNIRGTHTQTKPRSPPIIALKINDLENGEKWGENGEKLKKTAKKLCKMLVNGGKCLGMVENDEISCKMDENCGKWRDTFLEIVEISGKWRQMVENCGNGEKWEKGRF